MVINIDMPHRNFNNVETDISKCTALSTLYIALTLISKWWIPKNTKKNKHDSYLFR